MRTIIMFTALKEKVRQKVFYISAIIGIFILMLFSTGGATVSIGGVAVTDYRMLTPILLTLINALSCALAVIIGLGTIPNEYERRTSHLIWIRGVSQAEYHSYLTAANILSAMLSELILYAAVLIYLLTKNYSADLWRILPAYLISSLCVCIVSLLTGWLSVLLPRYAAGTVSAFVMIAGILYSVLDLAKNILGGFSGKMLGVLLYIIPDLNGIQAQAGNFLTGGDVDIHILLKGLFFAYIFLVLLLLSRKKEA